MSEDILLSHAGRQHAYKIAIALQRLNRLKCFVTSGYFSPKMFPDRIFWANKSLRRLFEKRHEPGLSGKVRRYPLFELPELLVRKIYGNTALAADMVCLRNALFDALVARKYVRGRGVFWGFQGSCRDSLKAARQNGMSSFVEFTIGHIDAASRILGREKEKNPGWADSICGLHFPAWYAKRLREEPFIAGCCLAPSAFVKCTLTDAGVSPEKISVLPYGADLERFCFLPRKKDGLFQVLFVGSVGQRKGIKYLLDAYERVKSGSTALKIIGPLIGSGKAFKERSHLYEYLGQLSQQEIVKHMHQSHVLVLPSLFEGFSLVIPEAMATGMPVIASTHTGSSDIVREGIDGFTLSPGDVDSLAGKLAWLIANRDKTVEMGKNASERAKEFSWERYRDRAEALINSKILSIDKS